MGKITNQRTSRRPHRRCRPVTRAAAIALIGVFWVSSAAAYILPGPFVLELMARNLAGAQSRSVKQQVIIDDPAVSDSPVELTEELRFLLPGSFRSELLHQDSRRIHVVNHGESLTIMDERVVSSREGRFDRYKDLLLYQSRDMLHKTLLSHGVDVGIVSLGRSGDQIIYIIGAQYPDTSVSQLWVDKERLLPLRWINVFPGNSDGEPFERLDFVYSDWRQIDGTWYPMQIVSLLDEVQIRVVNATTVEVNVVIPGELMNIPYLQSLYTAPEMDQPQEEPVLDAVDEVEQTIEDFKKKFEP